jgi:hypothetical protein
MAGLLGVACAQSADIAHGANLDKPISLKFKIVQLPDALKEISKQTGVKLASLELINDLKVTVFVKDVAAGLVLEKIASVLGCEWVHDGDLWRLHMAPEMAHDRERFVQKEEELAQQDLTDEVKKLVEASGPQEAPKAGGGVSRMQQINGSVLGQVIGSLSAEQSSAFWRGDVVSARDPSLNNVVTAVPVPAAGKPARRAPISRAAIPMFLHLDPLLYQVRFTFRGAPRYFGHRAEAIVTEPAPTGKLATMPFGKSVLAWGQSIPTSDGWDKIPVKATDAVSPYSNQKFSVSDLYEAAFNATGIAIVADAFRVPVSIRAPRHVSDSFIDWLAKVKIECHVATRFEDGIVMSRHAGFWRLRKFEIPEATFRTLELRATKPDFGVADYAAFAGKLTPAQARAMELKDEVLAQVPTHPFERAMPALQFYSTLRSREIANAMKDGINVTNMDANQRQLFSNAIIQGPFFGSASLGFYSRISDFLASGDLRGMGFLAKTATLNEHNAVVTGQRLLFGLSVAEATTYTVAIE